MTAAVLASPVTAVLPLACYGGLSPVTAAFLASPVTTALPLACYGGLSPAACTAWRVPEAETCASKVHLSVLNQPKVDPETSDHENTAAAKRVAPSYPESSPRHIDSAKHIISPR